MRYFSKGNAVVYTNRGKRNRRLLKAEVCLIALLSLVFLSATVFGQSFASISGTITDATQAVLPGATVVATNVDTGVEAAGFQRAVRSDVKLNVGSQSRLNVSLAVAGTVTEVEVTGAIESVLLEAGSSTGTIMQADTISEIPMVGNNIMELIYT